ncbi:hypothetical protein CEXT_440041 [Caerostris extrusa]|uniref:Uncharacterized protein n=1 Tax=Caerostris extrusa TaxID=172846 RepID=A0AAV4SAY8_CAEEX|nr:hypothetical protein CEXT_440041 [Caerostris extrusa]
MYIFSSVQRELHQHPLLTCPVARQRTSLREHFRSQGCRGISIPHITRNQKMWDVSFRDDQANPPGVKSWEIRDCAARRLEDFGWKKMGCESKEYQSFCQI